MRIQDGPRMAICPNQPPEADGDEEGKGRHDDRGGGSSTDPKKTDSRNGSTNLTSVIGI